MSMIINRRHIILTALVVALAAAIFVNYRFSQPANVTVSAKTSSAIGDSAYVSGQNAGEGDYFASIRLTRTQSRDKITSVLKQVSSDTSATTAEKAVAVGAATQLAKDMNTELAVETLVRAKGFSDCVCLINGKAASIVVKPKAASGLSAADSAQIYDIALKQTNFSKNNITIIAKN